MKKSDINTEKDKECYLITGALGCIGSWTVFHLAKQGKQVIAFDVSEKKDRLNLLLTPEEQERVVFLRADLTKFDEVSAALQRFKVTHLIHLAALQVPFCKSNPPLGAMVNVVGTVNVFEAARCCGLSNVVYASSIAVYGTARDYAPEPLKHNAPLAPQTLYGVYKQTNESVARIYWQDYKLSSTALRPHTVYGIGRDQGMTSDPTKAMLAAAAEKPFKINFANRVQLQFASDVALQFIEASRQPIKGAHGFNLGGQAVSMTELAEMIRKIVPDAEISNSQSQLPFPEAFDDSELRRNFTKVFETPLNEGIRQTIRAFQSYLANDRIRYSIDS